MSTAATRPPDTATLPEDDTPRLERQLAILGQLAEIGLTLAQAIERQVGEAGQDARATASAAVAYGRVARAVRLTIALQSRLIADARAPAEADLDRQRAERRTRIARIVGRAVDAELGPVSAAFRKPEIRERLEHDDIYGDLLARPASEIVAEVCEDLGVSPDWAQLAAEAWALDEIAGGAPGAPLARRPRVERYVAGPPNDNPDDDPHDDFDPDDDFEDDLGDEEDDP